MMISPQSYVKTLEKMTFSELIEERKNLLESIAELEKIVFDDSREGEAWKFHPGPDVRYQCCLEDLSNLSLVLMEKYREWNWNRLS